VEARRPRCQPWRWGMRDRVDILYLTPKENKSDLSSSLTPKWPNLYPPPWPAPRPSGLLTSKFDRRLGCFDINKRYRVRPDSVDSEMELTCPAGYSPVANMKARFELSIDSYGTVQGFIHPGTRVAEVRGIPYATVPGRFRSPALCKTLHGRTHEGTEFGYLPPTIPQAKQSQPRLPPNPRWRCHLDKRNFSEICESASTAILGWYSLHESEYNVSCICIEQSAVQASCDGLSTWYKTFRCSGIFWLRLFVGGSFKQGSANEPRHDGIGFVKASLKIEKPIVYVGIKYGHETLSC